MIKNIISCWCLKVVEYTCVHIIDCKMGCINKSENRVLLYVGMGITVKTICFSNSLMINIVCITFGNENYVQCECKYIQNNWIALQI